MTGLWSPLSFSDLTGPEALQERHLLHLNQPRPEAEGLATTWPQILPTTTSAERAHSETSVHLGASNDPSLFRTFGDFSARQEAEIGLSFLWFDESASVRLNADIVENPSDNRRFRWDGSYIAAKPGNWILGAGAVDRWWGPGWESSLILSNNARPIPSVWFSRNQNHAPESAFLSWIGPWHFTAFVGQLESGRAISDAKLLGARLTLMPLQGLEIGLSRTAQWSGEGRPRDFRSLRELTYGNTNQTHRPSAGNQLAAIDLRYGFNINNHNVGLYTQMLGEDEAGAFPAKKSYLAGVDWSTSWWHGSQRWYFEASDSVADSLFGDGNYNVTYEHSGYETGYRYRGRVIGSTFEGDATNFGLGMIHFSSEERQLQLGVGHTELNRADRVSADTENTAAELIIPEERQSVWRASAHLESRLLGGLAKFGIEALDRRIQLIGGRETRQVRFSGEWEYRF